jgi:hypothetical protein
VRVLGGTVAVVVVVVGTAMLVPRSSPESAAPGELEVALPGAGDVPAAADAVAPGAAGAGVDASEPDPVTCAGRRRCIAWEVALTTGSNLVAPPTDGLVVVGGGGEVLGIEAQEGTVRWRASRDGGRGPLGTAVATSAGLAAFVTEPDRLRAVDLELGRTAWTRELAGLRSVEAAATAGGLLHLAVRHVPADEGGSRGLLALDPDEGDLRWRHDGRAIVTTAGPVLVTDEGLLGLDPVDGEGRWERPLDLGGDEGVRTLALGPHVVVADGATVHVVAADDGRVVATAATAITTVDGSALLLHDGDQLGLVTAAGLAWWIPAPDGCCQGLHVTEDAVWLFADRRLVVHDHGDGAPRSAATLWLDGAAAEGPWWLVGGLLLGYEDRPSATGPARLLARDARTGAPVATLTSGAPVAVVDEDLLVLMGDRLVRLTAAPPPPARFGGGPAWAPGPA